MTLANVYELLLTTGLPVAYRQFQEPTSPPFLIYLCDGYNNFAADGKVYHSGTNIRIELYTNIKDSAKEALVEAALADFYYIKSETYIEGEKLYEVIYEMEV